MGKVTVAEVQPVLYEIFDPEVVPAIVNRISHALRDAVVLQQSDGTVIWHNPVACRLLRMSSAQLLGQGSMDPSWESINLDGSACPGEDHPVMRCFRTGEPVSGQIMGVRAGDDEVRWLDIDAELIEIEGEMHAFAIFTDITDAIVNERELDRTLRELQSRLVPPSLPSTDRFSFSSLYRSVGISENVGGDFFGAHVDRPHSTSLFIGDVCGHGVGAAGLSSLARNSLRALAAHVDRSDTMLGHLHDIVLEERPDTYLTAIHGMIDDDEGQLSFSFASGGHPLPILIRDGVATRLGSVGPLIGMFPNQARPIHRIDLASGDRVLMFTDGVTDDVVPRMSDDELLERLPTNVSLDEVIEMIGRLLDNFRSTAADDAAVLGFEVR